MSIDTQAIMVELGIFVGFLLLMLACWYLDRKDRKNAKDVRDQLERDRVIGGTLAWCNERRAERDMPPLADLPKGRRHQALSCPCGAATGLGVGLKDFVDLFDSGHFPQYDLDAEKGE